MVRRTKYKMGHNRVVEKQLINVDKEEYFRSVYLALTLMANILSTCTNLVISLACKSLREQKLFS